jgi:hypothetical protein
VYLDGKNGVIVKAPDVLNPQRYKKDMLVMSKGSLCKILEVNGEYLTMRGIR